jgi:serine/threonine-protein kinase
MFIVNMTVSPPGNSSTGTVSPPAVPATASADSPSPTQTAASPSPEDRKFPEKIVYAGRAEDNAGAIALAVLDDQAAAYFCDGRNLESWFRGSVTEDEISAKSKGGATLDAKLDGNHVKGTVEIKSEKLKFEINEAKKPAGLYRARGSKMTIGWIVLEDGSQVGVQTTGTDSAVAPELDPGNPQVTIAGENLDAVPVNGDKGL